MSDDTTATKEPEPTAPGAQIIPFPKPKKRESGPSKKARLRVEEHPVTCKAGPYKDLVGQEGLLYIDYDRKGEPMRGHFDPDDEDAESVKILGVESLKDDESGICLHDGIDAWVFAPLADEDDEDEDDEDEEDEDDEDEDE